VYVNVTFKSNMLFATLPVTGTVVIYDVAKVPVQQFKDTTSVVAGSKNYLCPGMNIPKWAFVGQATVFANALTAIGPEGVPYCKEQNSTSLSIIA
jgi:hypothetical protein